MSCLGCELVSPAPLLRTAQAPAQVCDAALMFGTLTEHPQSGLGITSTDGQATPVEWPFGYTAREDLGRLALVDETGRVVAHAGDDVTVGGGFGTQFWHACGPVSIVVSD
jgi:hypothetical protein